MDGERSHRRDHLGRVVVAARARAGDHDHEVRSRGRRPHRLRDLLRHVGRDLEPVRLAARRLGLGGEHQRRSCRAARRPSARSRPDGARRPWGSRSQPAGAAPPARSRPRRPRPPRRPARSRWPAGSSSSAALTSSPIDRTCWNGAAAACSSTPAVDLVHVLAHDDGVEVAGNRVARVDDLERARAPAGPGSSRRRRPSRRRGRRCRPWQPRRTAVTTAWPTRARPSHARRPGRAEAAPPRAAPDSPRPRTPPPTRRAPRRPVGPG